MQSTMVIQRRNKLLAVGETDKSTWNRNSGKDHSRQKAQHEQVIQQFPVDTLLAEMKSKFVIVCVQIKTVRTSEY